MAINLTFKQLKSLLDEQNKKIADLEEEVFDLTEEREQKVLDLDVFYKAEWNACEELKELKEQIKDQDDYDIDVSVNYWKSGWEILQAENEKLTEENKKYKDENKLLQEMLVEIGLIDEFKELLMNPLQ